MNFQTVTKEEPGYAKQSFEQMIEEVDMVNSPPHYNQGDIQCIDAMVSAFGKENVQTYCVINAFKYNWRAKHKNGDEDIDKAIWYLNKYKELAE